MMGPNPKRRSDSINPLRSECRGKGENSEPGEVSEGERVTAGDRARGAVEEDGR